MRLCCQEGLPMSSPQPSGRPRHRARRLRDVATGGLLVLVPLLALRRTPHMRELVAAATTDAKTGLLNARAWEQVARRALDARSGPSRPGAVLVVDIDRFKLVNDRYGHLAGDLALRAVGRALAANVRAADRVGRFGGEEFVVVLPGAADVAALAVAERLRAAVARLRLADCLDEPAADLPISVSIGVACAPQDGTALADLLRAADRALFAAKGDGRNRVALAGRGGGGPAPPRSG
jgi:diguanylate cyclase (GGDEF)-like protein